MRLNNMSEFKNHPFERLAVVNLGVYRGMINANVYTAINAVSAALNELDTDYYIDDYQAIMFNGDSQQYNDADYRCVTMLVRFSFDTDNYNYVIDELAETALQHIDSDVKEPSILIQSFERLHRDHESSDPYAE